jgi:two-component system repressor protein LuxO
LPIEVEQPPVILLDLKLPDMDGFEILRLLKQKAIPSMVVVITAHGSIDMAVEAMRLGAVDFLQKPFDAERLRVTAMNALDRAHLTDMVETLKNNFERDSFADFIGSSLPMQTVYRIIESAAGSSASVFVTGESGTGKEICAEALHSMGLRSEKPLVTVNCAGIPRDLMESEIFGHAKEAFTGALGERIGAASLADGGTLFLDEIGEVDLDLQSKLLRFIQTGTFKQVGSNEQRKVDVRFVCATNRDPLEMIEQGRFREDLYYRLHVVPIELPPLRTRGEDVLAIAQHYLGKYAEEEGKRLSVISSEVEALFRRYDWPGNVRQLENVIRNVVVLNDGEVVTKNMLPAPLNQLSTIQPISQFGGAAEQLPGVD